MTVLCLVEQDQSTVIDASLGALTFARELAQPAPSMSAAGGSAWTLAGDLAAVFFGPPDELPVGMLSSAGVGDAYAVESAALTSYAPVAWARVLAELIEVSSATAVVAAGTDRGNEVLAHLGAITGLPMAANCLFAVLAQGPGLARGPGAGGYRIVRQRWAGSLLEDAELRASPALLTVAPDLPASTADIAAETSVHLYRPALDERDLRVRVVESARPGSRMSLATARVVVGGGRGVGGPEGFMAIEELAGLLGAAVGVSRVVTSEGWRPHTQQVGQTGTRIAPELYLACGISGAIQHMAGCLGAKTIVAINTDPDAPIIGRADYAVIGDLKEVIPALVAAVRARTGES